MSKDPQDYTVLVVDDEEIIKKALVFDFKRRGFSVLAAVNGTDALALVRRNKVDLVLSDIRMPGGDGIALLENVRSEHPSVPMVILLSGFSDVDEAQCLARGARRVFKKPFDRKLLMQYVCESLGIEG